MPSQAARIRPSNLPKGLPQGRLREQALYAHKARAQQSRISLVEHIVDVIVGRNLLDPEQHLAVGTALALLQPALKGQKGHALREKITKAERPKSAIALLLPYPAEAPESPHKPVSGQKVGVATASSPP